MRKIKNVFTLGPTAQATVYTSIHDLAFDEWKNQRQKSSHLDLDVLLKDTQIPINIAWLVFIVP
jgi:hypothetical protein